MGYFNSEDVMMMGYFDFIGLLKILQKKEYELSLYPRNRDELHIKLAYRDRDTGYAFNVKEIVSLSAIEQCQSNPYYTLCNTFLRLMEQLDTHVQGFKRNAERVELPDVKET